MSTTGLVDTATVDTIWSELIKCYGSQHLTFTQQLSKLKGFPVVWAPNVADQLYAFSDLCYMTATLTSLCQDLKVLDLSVDLTKLVHKLPIFIQHQWEKLQYKYSSYNNRAHPPFSVFTQFLQEQAQREASRLYVASVSDTPVTRKATTVKVLTTSVSPPSSTPSSSSDNYCLEHQSAGHHLSKCKPLWFGGLEFSQRLPLCVL